MLCLGAVARAQYTDFVGAGQDDDIVATASSEDIDSPTAGASAQDSVSGSGLDGDAHSTAWEDTWTSYATAASPNPVRGDSTWIHYDLGHVYGLGLMHVWNGNEVTGRGPSSVTIDYSVDGTNWTELGTFDDWPQAPDSPDYTGFEGPDFVGASAQYVLITVNSTHGSDGDWTAISEIKIEVGAARAPITVATNDLPVNEPQDEGGPPAQEPTEGELLVSFTWQPGDGLGYPPFTARVEVDPNEGPGPHEEFQFTDPTPDANGCVFLTFDETNWNIPQPVTVEANADTDREGDENFQVELTVTIDIADANFSNASQTTSVGILDNDIPYISVLPVDPCAPLEGTLSENDPCVPVCVNVTLSHLPTDDVYVIVVRETGYEILLESMSVMDPPLGESDDPNRLLFTPGNYNTPQQICLEARDDDIRGEGPEEEGLEWVPGVVIFTPYSEDVRYLVPFLNPDGSDGDSGGEAGETIVDFNVQDNECGARGYSEADMNGDCVVNLSEVAMIYNQWLYCNYKDGKTGLGVPVFVDCDAAWNLEEE